MVNRDKLLKRLENIRYKLLVEKYEKRNNSKELSAKLFRIENKIENLEYFSIV